MSKKCVACAEEILAEARLCRFCQTWQDGDNSATPELKSASSAQTAKTRRFPRTWVVVTSLLIGLLCMGVIFAEYQRQVSVTAELAAQEAYAEQQAAKEAERKAAEEEAELESRKSFIPELESSILDMVKDHLRKGTISGKALSVSCTPVDGYSLANVDEITTEFTCFAATKDNGDGTQSGYYYSALMNWSTGEYSYGIER